MSEALHDWRDQGIDPHTLDARRWRCARCGEWMWGDPRLLPGTELWPHVEKGCRAGTMYEAVRRE